MAILYLPTLLLRVQQPLTHLLCFLSGDEASLCGTRKESGKAKHSLKAEQGSGCGTKSVFSKDRHTDVQQRYQEDTANRRRVSFLLSQVVVSNFVDILLIIIRLSQTDGWNGFKLWIVCFVLRRFYSMILFYVGFGALVPVLTLHLGSITAYSTACMF